MPPSVLGMMSIFLAVVAVLRLWRLGSSRAREPIPHWAISFVLCTSGAFITGGLFAYLVMLPFSLEYLLGVGDEFIGTPMVTVSAYFGLFVNSTLGWGIAFALPVLIFFLSLVRITTSRLLVSYARHAILGIILLAAVATPTADVFNQLLFALPLIVMYSVGVLASYCLECNRV